MAFRYQQAGVVPPSVGSIPPRLVASAFGVVPLPAEYGVEMAGAYNLVAGMYLDVGLYMVGLISPQPDTDYFVVASDGTVHVGVAEQAVDGFVLAATDAMGAPVEAGSFNVQVYRIEG